MGRLGRKGPPLMPGRTRRKSKRMALHRLHRQEGRGGFLEIVADYNANNLRIQRLIGTCEGGPWNVYVSAPGVEWRRENIMGPLEVTQAVSGQQWAFTRDDEGGLISPISAAIY